MVRKIKTLLLFVVPVLLSACINEDNKDNCGIYLEFVYEHNMEYSDSFNPQVNVVDVFVFDETDNYLFTRRAECEEELIDRKRIYLSEGFKIGKKYKILTVGGLCDRFCFANADGTPCIEGVTTLEEVRLSLEYESDQVSHEFPHLWYGETTEILYLADLSVWQVPLIKNTNKFTFVLSRLNAGKEFRSGTPETIPYTFEVVTPEKAVYGYDNAPLIEEQLAYHPYQLTPGETSQSLSVGRLNTMRLFDRENDYRFVIRNTTTRQVVWNYDLMYLLRETKPATRPDGTSLPMQEYLDRKSEWEIIILYQGDMPGENGFLVVGVVVNDWILWLHDVDL